MGSRVQKTLLNARVNLIFYFLTLCLSFFSRKIFLDCLGADFVGLTGTLQNLLSFLNLAELGIGGAIGYLLYKPLFNQDHDKINEIISVMGYLYRWIGGIILGAGCVLACFLPLIFPETGFDLALIYFAYFSFLGSSMIGYFINYRQNLLGADQRNYVVTGYYQTMNICKTIIQLALAYYTRSYYLWVLIELSFGIIYSFVLNWKINRTYPWLKADVALGRRVFKKYPEVMKYTRQLFIHRISAFAQFQVSPFLIYAYVSLSTVAYYNNYTILINKIDTLLDKIFSSASAGVGNLIAEGNKARTLYVFWEIMSFRYWISGIIIFGLLNYANAFIINWLGEDYLLSDTILYLLIINFFISISRSSCDPFLFGSGMFYDTWAPVTEAILYVIVAVLGGYYWGLPGIILGSTVSLTLIILIWKPVFLFKFGFKLPLFVYWSGWLKYTLMLVICVISYSEGLRYFNLMDNISLSWHNLLTTGLWQLSLFTIFYFCVMWACAPFRSFINLNISY
jgi:O-antigen/teichoic acid export membrane protein